MGIIKKQTIQGTVYSYIGVGIGFFTSAILFPRILAPGEIGLLKLLVSFSIIFAQFGSLGFINVVNRLFPYFRDKESGHHGFLTVAITISVTGFLVSWLILEIFKPMIIRNNLENSGLFVEYIEYLIPLIFFTIFLNLFDSYLKVIYDAVIGTVLRELIQRMLILGALLIYFAGLTGLPGFVLLYVIALSLPSVVLLIVAVRRGQFRLTRPGPVFTVEIIKEIKTLSLYGILMGFGGVALLQIDSIMVNKFLGLADTGIYATTFYFGTLILIPSRPLIKIATAILADSWKQNDLDNIRLIYRKSSINQAVISILLFVGLWVNIENIFQMLPPEYESGKWVIFFIGLSNVIEMATGINNIILQTSIHYRLNTFFIFISLVILVAANLILIPVAGITGAAIAALLSTSVTNLVRFIFLKFKFDMQPFDYRIFVLVIIGGISYLAGHFIPVSENFIIDIIIRSAATGVIFFTLVLVFRVSEDINEVFTQIVNGEFFRRK